MSVKLKSTDYLYLTHFDKIMLNNTVFFNIFLNFFNQFQESWSCDYIEDLYIYELMFKKSYLEIFSIRSVY